MIAGANGVNRQVAQGKRDGNDTSTSADNQNGETSESTEQMTAADGSEILMTVVVPKTEEDGIITTDSNNVNNNQILWLAGSPNAIYSIKQLEYSQVAHTFSIN